MNEKIYKERRDRVLEVMADGVAIIPSATAKIRSNDTEYTYRQDSNFYYLTGIEEDRSILVLKKCDGKLESYLFMHTSTQHELVWLAERIGVDNARSMVDVDEVVEYDEFESKIEQILKHTPRLYIDIFADQEQLNSVRQIASSMREKQKKGVRELIDITHILEQMRLKKSEAEIELIRAGLKITAKAHHDAMRSCKAGVMEYELAAQIEYTFAKHGCTTAYGSIVAGGFNANTLHYIANNQRLQDGDLVLIDAGCEYKMYATDITRTFPVNGHFSRAQKEIYNSLLKLQQQLIKMVKPKVLRSELQEYMVQEICKILIEIGVLSPKLDEHIQNQNYKKYIPHGVGHWMGIDVHDRCAYYNNNLEEIAFEAGMVLTIEPAIYLQADDESVPPPYRGIGIRIEDNILVTNTAHENLSIDIAKSVEQIELTCNLPNPKQSIN